MTSGFRWRKSSYSDGQGGNCVEVAGTTAELWRRASRSDNQGGMCVEVAGAGCACEVHQRVIAVRDSKDPEGPVLAFGAPAWRGLAARIKSGLLDLG